MSSPPPTGDTAKVYTGIRDVPIYAGESSPGNRLPGGPYRRPELIAIAAITIPTIWWVRGHVDSGYALPVLLAGAALAVAVTAALRAALPTRRPSLSTRAQFLYRTVVPLHRATTAHNPEAPKHAYRPQL